MPSVSCGAWEGQGSYLRRHTGWGTDLQWPHPSKQRRAETERGAASRVVRACCCEDGSLTPRTSRARQAEEARARTQSTGGPGSRELPWTGFPHPEVTVPYSKSRRESQSIPLTSWHTCTQQERSGPGWSAQGHPQGEARGRATQQVSSPTRSLASRAQDSTAELESKSVDLIRYAE